MTKTCWSGVSRERGPGCARRRHDTTVANGVEPSAHRAPCRSRGREGAPVSRPCGRASLTQPRGGAGHHRRGRLMPIVNLLWQRAVRSREANDARCESEPVTCPPPAPANEFAATARKATFVDSVAGPCAAIQAPACPLRASRSPPPRPRLSATAAKATRRRTSRLFQWRIHSLLERTRASARGFHVSLALPDPPFPSDPDGARPDAVRSPYFRTPYPRPLVPSYPVPSYRFSTRAANPAARPRAGERRGRRPCPPPPWPPSGSPWSGRARRTACRSPPAPGRTSP